MGFEPDIFPECEKVLKMGSSIVSLPMSTDEWQHTKRKCDSPVGATTTALRGSRASEANATTTIEASEAQRESTTAAPEECSGEDPMVQMVLDLAPDCFKVCPALCLGLEAVVPAAAANPDRSAIEKLVCAEQEQFSCALQHDHLEACEPVLSAGSSFGVPQTGAEMSRRCSAITGGVAHDQTLPSSARGWRSAGGAVMLMVVCMLVMLDAM